MRFMKTKFPFINKFHHNEDVKDIAESTEGNRMRSSRRAVVWLNRLAPLLHFAAAFAGYFIIEALARHSLEEAGQFLTGHPKVFLYNTLLIFITTLPVFLFRRRTFWRLLIAAFWLLLGVANGIILSNRVTPLTGADLHMISEGLSVINRYVSVAGLILIAAGIIVLVLLLVFVLVKSPVHRGRIYRIPILLLIAGSVFGYRKLTTVLINNRVISSYFGNLATAYQDYGFPYCLTVTVLDTGVNEPNGYSRDMITQIVLDEKDKDVTTLDKNDMPNIIFVQCETFFDPTRLRGITYSEDPLPNWHALQKEYTSGLYTVPVVGAGTVNSEFETLTGMSLRFFGAGEYPYKSLLLDQTCENAASVLERLGYSTHAVHDNQATFYRRNEVFANLGFDTFTSSEYMETQRDVNENNWMRDENLIAPINEALDSTDGRDFVFTVTVQPHGAYPSEHILTDPEITVSGTDSDEQNAALEYYVNQVHEEDAFVADLIADVEKRGEPTVILFYGDHLPTMDLNNGQMKKGTIYQTDYILWDNIGLEKKDKSLAAYQAAADVFAKLGIHDGAMFRFQQKMRKSESYFLDMQALQFDILYGDKYVYHGVSPYISTAMKMGVGDIEVNNVYDLGHDTWYVKGSNFTPSCKVIVDGKTIDDTVYIATSTLMIADTAIAPGSTVQVVVESNASSHKPLSYSNVYAEPGGVSPAESAEGEKSK